MENTVLGHLTAHKRQQSQRLLTVGRGPTHQLTHARILIKADEGPAGSACPDQRIAEALDVAPIIVKQVRQRQAVEGVAGALA